MDKIQFLTDEEYEAVRRDITTIVDPLWGEDVTYNDFKQAIGKLTAYVDQKIKRYY